MAKKRRKTKRQLREERQKKLRKRKRKRIILLTVEIIILAALLVAAYGIFKLGKLDYNVLNKKKLEVYKDTGEYTNIALFGLDSRNNELDGGVQSDCIMIASINNKTSDVKLVSLYTGYRLLRNRMDAIIKQTQHIIQAGPEEANQSSEP